MESLGPLHHKNAVHAKEHMPVFETVINAMLQQVLRFLRLGSSVGSVCVQCTAGRIALKHGASDSDA